MTDDWLDFYLDNILKASGSALKHYSMQKTKDDMRQALRQAIKELEGQEPVAWEHLKTYGYAPGGYMMTCHGCNKQVINVDKRASLCRPCAKTAYAKDTYPPQRKPLTDEQAYDLFGVHYNMSVIRNVEAAHGIKE